MNRSFATNPVEEKSGTRRTTSPLSARARSLSLSMGEDPVSAPESMWDGLEAFPAYDDEVEPAVLASACAESLGIAPTASGLVDHTTIGDAWEAADGRVSIVNALLEQLES